MRATCLWSMLVGDRSGVVVWKSCDLFWAVRKFRWYLLKKVSKSSSS